LVPLTDIDTSVDLRRQWSEERAYRMGHALAKAVLILITIAMFINFRYAGWLEVSADLVMVFSCILSLYLSHRLKPKRHFVWWPFYIGYILSTLPSTYLSGGLYGPWLGFYLSVFIPMATVIQTRIPPLGNLAFALFNVLIWLGIQVYYPYQGAGDYLHKFPPGFMVSSACIMMVGIGYCLHGLIRTEKDLAREIQRQYAELFATKATLLREENANQAKSSFLANISHE
jgi:signal transduction histidine kinase